jgi:hypothetical protein
VETKNKGLAWNRPLFYYSDFHQCLSGKQVPEEANNMADALNKNTGKNDLAKNISLK